MSKSKRMKEDFNDLKKQNEELKNYEMLVNKLH